MAQSERLTTQQFWETGYTGTEFKKHDQHGIDDFIKKYIPPGAGKTCLEVGSYPGPHLATFGELGYILNGIDFHPGNTEGLPRWLQSLGLKTGEFLTVDFFDFITRRKYDVVASFGFIEHFNNYKEIITKHASLVSPNGYLVITTPNFRGIIQHWLHRSFDKTNLSFHNTESMNPVEWEKLLSSLNFSVIYRGYFGGFWFWRNPEKMSKWKSKALWLIERIIPRVRRLLWFNSPSFSAYCGIVAKRIG